MLYGPTPVSPNLSNRLGLVLGWWHIFKFCHTLVFTRFASTFLAPAWHALFPNATISSNGGRLSQLSILFTQLRMAYPVFSHSLAQAKAGLNRILPALQPHLLNLVDLFEFFIPTVSVVSYPCTLFFRFWNLNSSCRLGS